MVKVVLSQQDLSDFLEDNIGYMESYRGELESRLSSRFGEAEVEISRDALTDKIETEGERDGEEIVQHVMSQMTEDWSWLRA